MSRLSELYRQLKNRRVIRAGVIYLALFWLLLQMADLLAGSSLGSEEMVRWLIFAGVVLFPIVLVLSWFYEHPWHQRQGLSMAGDLALLVTITVAASLLARQQWQKSFTRPVIAMLPLEVTDIQPGTEQMANHLGRRFRTLLAVLPEVRVIEPGSSWHSSLTAKPMTEKAQMLGADYLVTGTVNQTQLNIRLNIQLFDAEGELLWSERYRDRVIDQIHLQNSVISGLWTPLNLKPSELIRISELLHSCEYPADRDLIIELAEAELLLSTTDDIDRQVLEQLITELDLSAQDLLEAGLVHLVRARARLALLQVSRPEERPVLQELVRQDLEEARFLCPEWPEIEKMKLLMTRKLESQEVDIGEIVKRHPNDVALLQKLAAIAIEHDDTERARAFQKEACVLDPLSPGQACSQDQL